MKALLQRLVAYPATGIVDVQFFPSFGFSFVRVRVRVRVLACSCVRSRACVRM